MKVIHWMVATEPRDHSLFTRPMSHVAHNFSSLEPLCSRFPSFFFNFLVRHSQFSSSRTSFDFVDTFLIVFFSRHWDNSRALATYWGPRHIQREFRNRLWQVGLDGERAEKMEYTRNDDNFAHPAQLREEEVFLGKNRNFRDPITISIGTSRNCDSYSFDSEKRSIENRINNHSAHLKFHFTPRVLRFNCERNLKFKMNELIERCARVLQ